jgi:hypothetical protein
VEKKNNAGATTRAVKARIVLSDNASPSKRALRGLSWIRSMKGLANVSEIVVLTMAQSEEALSIADAEGEKIEIVQAKKANTPVKRVTGSDNIHPKETPNAVVSAVVKMSTRVNTARLRKGARPGRRRVRS